jgi:hypothetical protein
MELFSIFFSDQAACLQCAEKEETEATESKVTYLKQNKNACPSCVLPHKCLTGYHSSCIYFHHAKTIHR